MIVMRLLFTNQKLYHKNHHLLLVYFVVPPSIRTNKYTSASSLDLRSKDSFWLSFRLTLSKHAVFTTKCYQNTHVNLPCILGHCFSFLFYFYLLLVLLQIIRPVNALFENRIEPNRCEVKRILQRKSFVNFTLCLPFTPFIQI